MVFEESRRRFIRTPFAVTLERPPKWVLESFARELEQGHAGTKFHIVQRPEDRVQRTRLVGRHAIPTLNQSWYEQWMGEVGARFVQRADSIEPSRLGATETPNLLKNEPHLVATLAAALKLVYDGVEDARLGRDETLEIERIGCRQVPCIAWAYWMERQSHREA